MGLIENLKSYSDKLEVSAERKEILNSFLTHGFPTTKDEEWKYTSLKKIVSNEYAIENTGEIIDSSTIEKYSLGFDNKIIFSDGKLINTPEIKGVSISSFSNFESATTDSISQLNKALAQNGFTIIVNKNTVVENPIEILFFATTKDNFSQYRNLISVGDNAEVKFVERIQNLNDSPSMVNHFTQIHCDKNTKVEYNKIQNNTAEFRLIDTVNVYQEQDSTCDINTLIFGGSFTRNNLNFEQNGSNCESNMNGISILDDNQLADNHTFVDHKSAHCRSNEMYKGVYLGYSKGVFNGKIMVRPDAQKIDAFQSNNNLLLSETSTIDSKPQLEIYADDVKCSHGCTIGQLDENALFYMRSRGIWLEEAKAVLTYAFASEAIENISVEEVKLLAQKLLAKKLNVDLD
ncbi:MAG: Fe-S cluster assembly protein SufD, partial [Flavobacteriales bacterium]|nr:Fe-S cluster assembly protein SufD [Flavobacteriales bacterium]